MLVLYPPCEHCGVMPPPEDVACDKCERTFPIPEFAGIIVHFSDMEEGSSSDEPELCDECSLEDILRAPEFHFCDMKCFAEFLADPNTNRFSDYDDKGLALYMSNENASLLFYALAGSDFNE